MAHLALNAGASVSARLAKGILSPEYMLGSATARMQNLVDTLPRMKVAMFNLQQLPDACYCCSDRVLRNIQETKAG